MGKGDLVRFPAMPDFGVGEIIGINTDGTFKVKFETCTCRSIFPDSLIIDNACNKEKPNSKFFEKYNIQYLCHLTHKDNVNNILKDGILSHHDALNLHDDRIDISDPGAQRWRDQDEPLYNRKIHDYVPLYIQPLNPMLYVRQELQRDLCWLEVSLAALDDKNTQFIISDGNAASRETKFYTSVSKLDMLPWDVLKARTWFDLLDGKRKRCAEVLIYPKISPEHVVAIHCYCEDTVKALSRADRRVLLTRRLFF